MAESALTSPNLDGYVFTQELYRGGKTLVYRAVPVASHNTCLLTEATARANPPTSVIIKLLNSHYPQCGELVRFRNQYVIAQNLEHPGIVSPLALEPWQHSYALVMEDFGGIALNDYVKTNALSWSQVLNISLQMVNILQYLGQKRVIHKDIKPANILIHPKTKQIQLIDFSLASLLLKEYQELQSPGNLEGTLAYLAPEQTGRMNRGIDYRADFYGLGVTLYELLTGKLPFESDDAIELLHCHLAKVPVAPHEASRQVPQQLSAVVLKLMAKNAEDRFQSALGLKHDLQECLNQWRTSGQIETFELGQRDVSDRFIIPEKLYGRDAEVQTLLDAFERVAQGSSELMLVAGFAGVGKTAVMNEVHKPITRQKGYFIKGKFDQFNRNIPFSAFVQAFRSLMEQLLGETDAVLVDWKTKILTAVGDSGQVLIEVIPELELIIGVQSAVPNLTGAAAQNRLNVLFGKFIQVFTTLEHPLVIFLDDLQWADSASLSLLKVLMVDSQPGHLLVMGAYRDNEVYPAHSLMLTLAELQAQDAIIETLTLGPLAPCDINQFVADALLYEPQLTTAISEFIYQKSQGNPFFATQLLQEIYEDGQIHFDAEAGYWHCDLSQVTLTEDVVEFMVTRLQKLPKRTQEILKIASCVGNRFDLATLALVCKQSQETVAQALWQSLQLGFVLPEDQTYKFFLGTDQTNLSTLDSSFGYRFLHDRVQQAAHALVPEANQAEVHLKIGRLLLYHRRNETTNIFSIVENLNKGADLISDVDEKRQLACLNLEAGQAAKQSIAYTEAISYLQQGIQILGPQGWNTQYSLILELYSELANVHWLRGEFDAVNSIFTTMVPKVHHMAEALPLYISHISSELAQGNIATSLELGLQVLSTLEVQIPRSLSKDDIQKKLHQVQTEFRGKSVQAFVELPQNHDPQFLRIQALLTLLVSHAFYSEPELLALIVSEQVSLLMRHGNIPASASIYALYGMLLSGVQDFESSFFAGEVALAVREAFPEKQFEMRVLNLVYSYITPWQSLFRKSLSPLKQGFALGLEAGDIEYTAYGIHHYALLLYFSGVELATVDHEISTYSNILKKHKQEGVLQAVQLLHQAVLNLITASDTPWMLEGNIFQESNHISDWQENNLGSSLAVLYITKLLLAVLVDNKTLSLEYAAAANDFYRNLTGEFQLSHFHCYRALAYLGTLESPKINAKVDNQIDTLTQVAIDLEALEKFTSYAPMNFQHQLDLVQAERYRVLGQRLEAMEAYDRAIAGAKENQYLQEEALANELAAKFYLDWRKDKVAAGYMQEAYYCYARWGAKAKTDDLEKRYPQLLQPILQQVTQPSDSLATLNSIAPVNLSTHSSSSITSTSTGGINQTFDLATVFKSSQLLTESIDLDELLEKLSQMMLQTSGTDRCTIIMPDNRGHWQVRTKATLEAINLTPEPLNNSSALPVQLILYVKNTQEMVVLDDASDYASLVGSYFQPHQSWSALAAPMLHQGKLIGILYLQNQSTTGVFTHDRITVINFLCSQAAIALENAQLYQLEQRKTKQLAASEGRLKTLFNQAADAVLLWGEEGLIDCNQAALDLFCYPSKEHLLTLKLHQLSPEQQPDGQRSEIKAQDMLQEAFQRCNFRFEWVHQRFGGDSFWAEITLTAIKYGDEIVFHCIARDISDRKQAEDQLKELSQRLELALESAKIGIWEWNFHDNCLSWDKRMFEIYGISPKTFAGSYEDFEQFVHPDDLARIKQKEQQETENPVDIEFRMIRSDGSVRHIASTVLKQYNDQRQPIRAVGTNIDITERKHYEKRLQMLSNKLELAIKSAQIGIWECNFQDNYLSWDKRMFELYGISPETFKGTYQDWVETVHPDDLEQALMAEEDKNPISKEFRIIRSDGSIRHIVSTFILESDNQAQFIRAVGTNIDITERKISELALKDSQERLKRITENIPGMIFRCVMDPDGNDRVTHISSKVREIYELEPDAVLADGGRQMWTRTHPDDLSMVAAEIQISAETLQPFKNEQRLILPKKGLRWIQSIAQPEQLDNGYMAWDGIVIDITERKAIEFSLQKSEEKFRTLVSNIHGAVYRSQNDDAWTIYYISDAIFELSGYPASDFIENNVRTYASIIYSEDTDYVSKMATQAIENHESFILEYRILHRDGSIRWVYEKGKGIFGQDNQLQHLEGVIFDISDRKQAEAKLQRTNEELMRATRLKDEFLANMSHELRTPLNAILGMTEGLEEGVLGELNDNQLSAVQITRKSGLHLLELINEILDLAKIESGQAELVYAEASIQHLCEDSLTFVKQQALKKGVRLHLQVPPSLPDIEVDERRIRQVLINLLNNAVKFTSKGGDVMLTAMPLPVDETRDQAALSITIADTGIGIAPENLNKLFQPFIQIDSALNRQYEGTGLGLALVKQVVDLHGGSVAVTSEIDVGSNFIIELPYPTLEHQHSSSVKAASESSQLIPKGDTSEGKPLILLAEDNEANIKTISTYLEAKGYRLIVAQNGEAAIELAKAELPDLILMDIQMPGMDGLVATQQIRQIPALAKTPIIALTALAMVGDEERCLAAGANLYMSKPIRLKQLVLSINEWLNMDAES